MNPEEPEIAIRRRGPPRRRSFGTLAVIYIEGVAAAYPLHRATVDREDSRVALLERQDHDAGLHAGTLLGHHEPAALEVVAWLIQQDRDLYRENTLSVEVAMEAVVVLRRVFE